MSQYCFMWASIHSNRWNWTEIAAVATVALAFGTFWMAWGTRRLGKQALIESGNAHKLAKAAEDQRDIASRNEYALRQPIFIPIVPHRDSDTRYFSYPVGGATLRKLVEASFVSINQNNLVNVRIVLRNVGRGAGRILQQPSPIRIDVAIGATLHTSGTPSPVIVGPGDTVEIWAVGRPAASPQLVPEFEVRGFLPYVRLQFQYTDLTNTMITDCDVLYDQAFEDELRPIDVLNSHPRTFSPDELIS